MRLWRVSTCAGCIRQEKGLSGFTSRSESEYDHFGAGLSEVAGKKVNEKGEVLDKSGNVIGRVKVVPGEAADEALKELQERIVAHHISK